MSLGGLAIAIGLIVDAAVVVVENTVERLQRQPADDQVPFLHHVYAAAAEVAAPVASGILIICLVFLPLLSLQGLEGKMFAPVALTIIFALSGSLLLSLHAHSGAGLLRAACRPPPRAVADAHPSEGLPQGAHLLACVSGPGIRHCGDRAGARRRAYLSVGKTFMPTMDEGAVIMQTIKLPSINLSRSIAFDLLIQRTLREKVPEIERIISRVGADELGLDPMGLNEADNFLVLKPKDQWRVPNKDWLLKQLREAMAELPGTDFAFTQPIEMRTSEMLTGSRGNLAVKIFGPDLKQLAELAGRIKAVISKVSGAAEVMTASNGNVDYLQISLDRLAAGRTKLSVARIQDELRAMLEGTPAGMVVEPGRRTNIIIRGSQDVRERPNMFSQMQLTAGDGGLVSVGDLALVERRAGPVKIDRENASRFAIVQAYVAGRDLVGFVEDAQRAIAAEVQLPPGYRLVWGGEFENQKRAAARLSLVVPVALGLIFLVLFATLALDAAIVAHPHQRAVRNDRRNDFAMALRRISLGACVGRIYRSVGDRRAQRVGVGQPFQPALGERSAPGSSGVRRRAAPASSGSDDGQHCGVRPHSIAVRHRSWIGNSEAAGGCGHWRARHLHPAHACTGANSVSRNSGSKTRKYPTQPRSVQWTSRFAS